MKLSADRTQSDAWLWEFHHPFLHKLSAKLDHFLPLEISNQVEDIIQSEAYQVGVYAPGGLYVPHYDSFIPLDV